MMNHPAGDGALRGVLKNFLRFVRWFFGWCKLSVTSSRFAGCDSWSCNHAVKIPYLGGGINTVEVSVFVLSHQPHKAFYQ